MPCDCNQPSFSPSPGAPSLPGGAPALPSSQHRRDCISSVMHDHGYTTREVLDWLIAKCASPPAASAAGSDGQVTFNDGGTPAGDAGLTWDKTNNRLTIITDPTLGEAFLVRMSGGGKSMSIGENAPTHALISFGDVDQSYNNTFFQLSDAGATATLSAPGGQITLGDPNVITNGSLVVIDDANQAVTSNVKIVVTSDVIVDDSSKGMVLKSPNGHYWRGTIDNAGALSWADLGTSLP